MHLALYATDLKLLAQEQATLRFYRVTATLRGALRHRAGTRTRDGSR